MKLKRTNNIVHKKKYGQHFLRWQRIADDMVHAVQLDDTTSVMEIGCGDGFLTKTILRETIARLWVYEIDPEWAAYVRSIIPDERLTVIQEDILHADLVALMPYYPWVLLSNLPYQITFPILFKIQQHRQLFTEGVVMVQEEVAQKILKTSGRGYGYISLFFQHYFFWKKLTKIPPQAFEPPPKVHSRLLYFTPKQDLQPIPDEKRFWKFIKMCFHQPRRTLKNNLLQSQYPIEKIPQDILSLRAQQMSFEDFLDIWKSIL